MRETEGQMGWLPNPVASELYATARPYKSVSEYLEDLNLTNLLNTEAGNTDPVLLYEMFRTLGVGDIDSGPQGIGDCVDWGWVGSFEIAQAAGIVAGGQPWEYQKVLRGYTYAASRCEVGRQFGSYSDGSVGAWAAEAAVKYGWMSEKEYQEKTGKSGKYDSSRSKEWGAKGVPDDLEPIGKKRPFDDTVSINTFEEAVAMIRLLKAIPVCSGQGFSQQRDANGFCKPQGTWQHCMYFQGFRLDIPGLLCTQSWGPNSPTGPRFKDQPANTFYVDAKTVNSMFARRDSFAPIGMKGYTIDDALAFYKF